MRIRGLDLDLSELDLPDGSTTFARNVIISKKAGAWSNEDGNELRHTYNTRICGIIELDDSRTIIFLGFGGVSEIGIEDANGVYTSLIVDPLLKFDWRRPIKGVSTRNGLNETVISWCDGVDVDSQPIRILNIDNLGFELNSSKGFKLVTDVNYLALFPDISTPIFNLTKVEQGGGSLRSGAIFLFFRYVLIDGSTSNVIGNSGPIYIADDITNIYDGAAPGTPTNRSVLFKLTSLSEAYNQIELISVTRIGGVFEANIVDKYEYSNRTVNITLTGTEITETIDLNEVIVPKIIYDKSDSITITEGRLAIAKLETAPTIDYQKYANAITIEWQANQSGFVNRSYNSARNETWIFNHKGFKTEEVYAFYINFIFTNGTKSPAYHIPGRAAVGNKLQQTGEFAAASVKARQVDANAMVYQFEDTSNKNGGMSYWENTTELYPDNDSYDIWDINGPTGKTLAGTNVRHHKFPSHAAMKEHGKEMIYYNPTSADPNSPWIRPLGIKVSNIFIPAEFIELIDSYEISYAERTTANRTILDNGLWKQNSRANGTPAGSQPPLHGGMDGWEVYPFTLMHEEKNFNITHVIDEYRMFDVHSVTGTATTSNNKNTYNLGDPLHPKMPSATTFNGQPFQWVWHQEGTIIPVKNSFIAPLGPTTQGITPILASHYHIDFKLDEWVKHSQNVSEFNDGFNTSYLNIASLRAHKRNIYQTFVNQKLITINKVNKVGNIFTSTPYATADLYGGDTFICMDTKKIQNGSYPLIYAIPVESYFNISLRHSDEEAEPKEQYWPKMSNTISPSLMSVDHYTYNTDYNTRNQLIDIYPNDITEQESNTNKLYHRIARSSVQGKESTLLRWREFLAANYYEMPKHTGEISNIQGSSRDMYIHTVNTLYFAEVKDKLGSGEGTTFVGDADLFDRLPNDLLPQGKGILGCQDSFSTNLSKLGYFWVNKLHKRVFIYSRETGLQELNKYGLHNFFRDNLDVWSGDVRNNPYQGSGFSTIFDEENNRLLINKIDITGESFCISYSSDITIGEGRQAKKGGFVSFHDREAYVLYNKRNKLYSLINLSSPRTYEEGIIGSKGLFYDVRYDSYVDIVFNQGRQNSKVWQSVHWYSDFISPNGKTDYNRTIDKLLIYNQHSATGMLSLEKDKNLVRTEEGWNYNDFRDNTNQQEIQILDDKGNFIEGSINTNLSWFKKGKFISKYIIIRLLTNNEDDYEMRLSDVSMTVIKSDR